MCMNTLFTIIIPTFNSINSIKRTLNSIVNQNYQYYEILIIDGLSIDDTLLIVKRYAEIYNQIRYTSEQDNGIYDAMNKGIELAKGEWIIFLGSDDYFHDNNVLGDANNYIKNKSVDVLYGDAILLKEGIKYGGEFDLIRILTKQNLCHQTIFYRKEIFAKLGKYNLKYKIAADWDFNIRCFRHPDIKLTYMNRLIVFFNNIDGISSLPHEDPIYEELPLHYIRELNDIKIEIKKIRNSRAYILGRKIYSVLNYVGVISLLRKIKN